VEVALVLSNRADAFVLQRAKNAGVTSLYLPASELRDGRALTEILKAHRIDFIVLAGYLLLVPKEVIHAFPKAIVNIHPALLPDFGGKGMYGEHVHRAVIAAGKSESGITIHYVNEQYDDGAVIFQASCPVLAGDTADSLAERIHILEHEHYARVIGELLGTP
jgi:phosphoribosylglycinamide formyltransferase-1